MSYIYREGETEIVFRDERSYLSTKLQYLYYAEEQREGTLYLSFTGFIRENQYRQEFGITSVNTQVNDVPTRPVLPDTNDSNRFQMLMQLHDRGLIAEETLLREVGLPDGIVEREMSRRRALNEERERLFATQFPSPVIDSANSNPFINNLIYIDSIGGDISAGNEVEEEKNEQKGLKGDSDSGFDCRSDLIDI